MHCHAGCSFAQILAALNMAQADAFPADDRWARPTHARAGGRREQMRHARTERTQDWPALASRFEAQLSIELLEELGAMLGLPTTSIRPLRPGWANEMDLQAIIGKRPRGPAWIFPMRDGTGTIIGLCARGRDGAKWTLTGGSLGLFIPEGLDHLPDPVLVPEGASDTCAALAAGWAAVGRPSSNLNEEKMEYIATLLKGRRAVLIGENDRKPDGKWPGRDGAIKTADYLASSWKREVPWRLPPSPHKDLRAWMAATHQRGESRVADRVLGLAADRRSESSPTHDWPTLAAMFKDHLSDDLLAELGEILGLPATSITPLGPGWAEEAELRDIVGERHRGPAWIFPMRDASGKIIGLCALRGGRSKLRLVGGRAGLFVPEGIDRLPDPVLLPKGPAETAAALAAGWAAVGRPVGGRANNREGAEHAGALLKGRRLVVIGENDRKPGGKWPGRDGAISFANHLARVCRCEVPWRLPPSAHENLRAWMNATRPAAEIGSADSLLRLGAA
jgi:hypothetical protein